MVEPIIAPDAETGEEYVAGIRARAKDQFAIDAESLVDKMTPTSRATIESLYCMAFLRGHVDGCKVTREQERLMWEKFNATVGLRLEKR
jgi:hypothetical protein